MLTCSKCKEEKDTESFYRKSTIKRGYSYHCKKCADSYDTSANSRKTSKKYYEKHKAKSFEKSARYRASKLQATPPWLSDSQKEEMVNIYEKCRSLEDHHVDHIIPLKGKLICGLHVPWNLQIIPAKENLSKKNKVEYDQY